MRNSLYYIGLDIHKKTITYCIKKSSGRIVREGEIPATRPELKRWAGRIRRKWVGAMEATMFAGWVYDCLKPYAWELKVGHSKMMKAISASKKKNDRLDAKKIADLLRCDLLPESYMASQSIRDLRRQLRFRNFLVRISVKLKNKTATLLMEVGAQYNKKRLHGKKYFNELLGDLEDIPDSVIDMLKLSHAGVDVFTGIQKELVKGLIDQPSLHRRVLRLMTIPGVGEITALTWALEIGDPYRFRSRQKAVSYCGLCSAQNSSAGKEKRGPISKDRNKHLQTVLVECAKLAPRWNADLKKLYEHECERGNKNRATLGVARKIVAYLLAVDKRQTDFDPNCSR